MYFPKLQIVITISFIENHSTYVFDHLSHRIRIKHKQNRVPTQLPASSLSLKARTPQNHNLSPRYLNPRLPAAPFAELLGSRCPRPKTTKQNEQESVPVARRACRPRQRTSAKSPGRKRGWRTRRSPWKEASSEASRQVSVFPPCHASCLSFIHTISRLANTLHPTTEAYNFTGN